MAKKAGTKEAVAIPDEMESRTDSSQNEQTELSLEESFEKLDSLLERLEDPALPLEEAFNLYQQGLVLISKCNETIDTVEKKILIMNGDGGFDEF